MIVDETAQNQNSLLMSVSGKSLWERAVSWEAKASVSCGVSERVRPSHGQRLRLAGRVCGAEPTARDE